MTKQPINRLAVRPGSVGSAWWGLYRSLSWSHSVIRAGLVTVTLIALFSVSGRGQTLSSDDRSNDGRQVRSVLELSLKQAMTMALAPEGNARVQLAEQLIHQAEAQSAEVRAALLPHVEASLGQQNRTINLDAIGIRIDVPLPGFRRPEVVGPFNTFDARATLRQTLFDLSAIRRFQASRVGIRWARADRESTRDRIAAEVARAYLIAVRADSLLEAAEADVALAEALLKLAVDQKAAGTGTGIEVTRARVQLFKQRQRLLVAENERRRAHLRLLKLIGLNLDVDLRLTDPLSYVPVEPLSVQQALAVALQSRADFQAQQRRQERARLSYRATRAERVPSIMAFADYGSIGSSIRNASPTRTYGFSVQLPIFDGGRRDARRAEEFTRWQQERIRTRDLRDQIELEVRVALDALASAEEQVKVAKQGLALAEQELAQARRRYRAGVTTGLEVTDAQSRLERMRDNYIAALFEYNLARINLAQAMGTIRQMIK